MPTKGPVEPAEALVKENTHTHTEWESGGEETEDWGGGERKRYERGTVRGKG